jgi:hypothetical protein
MIYIQAINFYLKGNKSRNVVNYIAEDIGQYVSDAPNLLDIAKWFINSDFSSSDLLTAEKHTYMEVEYFVPVSARYLARLYVNYVG